MNTEALFSYARKKQKLAKQMIYFAPPTIDYDYNF